MSLYLDASVLVALFVIDPANTRAAAFLSTHPAIVVVSDFAAAEFASAVARRVRTGDLTGEDRSHSCISMRGSRVRHADRR